MRSLRLSLLFCAILLAGCSAPRSYTYRYEPGKTAVLRNGVAIAPPRAPAEVRAAIAAGNRIHGLPYRYGGGRKRGVDSGYDCSGAASYILAAAGRLRSPMPSSSFRNYGNRGDGRWISVYARKGHVFLVIAGLRYDTGWSGKGRGPQWTTRSRPAKGYKVRHPAGL